MKITKNKVLETWRTLNKEDFKISKDLSTSMLQIVDMTMDQFLRFAQLKLSTEQDKRLQQVCINNMLKKYDYLQEG